MDFLDGNKIKFMNGNLFKNFSKLEDVWLWSNVCIDEIFKTPAQIAVLPQKVDEKCGFKEPEDNGTTDKVHETT